MDKSGFDPAFDTEGLFDDDGNRKVLAEVARAPRPGGQLAIGQVHHVHQGDSMRFTACTEVT
jgi:hypothetical protein